MVDIRGFNGGMNTDASPELLPNGDYTYAMNIENTAEGIVNIPGNIAVGNTIAAPSGVEWVCGAHFDKKRQRVYYFTNNPTGRHRFMSHDVTTSTTTQLFIDNTNPIDDVSETYTISFSTQLKKVTVQAVIALVPGTTFTITGSNDNNKTLTAVSVNVVSNNTEIIVAENVESETKSCTIAYKKYSDSSDILGWKSLAKFDANYLIKDIKVIHRNFEGDLVYFIGPDKKLMVFNYESLRTKKYGNDEDLKLEFFSVLKAPPSEILKCSVVDDNTYSSNSINKKLFQFKYRFVFDDNEKSVWSAISKIPFPSRPADTQYNASGKVQNCIDIDFSTGDKNVAKVEIASRVNIGNLWSDFFLVDSIDKATLGIGDNTVAKYKFRNDGVYLPIDIQESNLLFDYVPDKSNTLELANGNTLVVGGLEDGYNKTLPFNPNQTVNSDRFDAEILGSSYLPDGTVSNLAATVRNAADTGAFSSLRIKVSQNDPGFDKAAGIIKFSGTPVPGDNITITLNTDWFIGALYNSRQFGSLSPDVETYSVTVQSGWAITDIISAFVNMPVRLKWAGLRVGGAPLTYPSKPFGTGPISNALYFGVYSVNERDIRDWNFNAVRVSVSKNLNISATDSIPCYKWFGNYKFGIVYYDKDGKTNGVYTTSSTGTNDPMSLRASNYIMNIGSIPSIPRAFLKINSLPPIWAEYYHVVRTKELSCDFSLIVVASKFERVGGVIRLDIQNIYDTPSLYPLSSDIINYTFVKGDRVRIIQKMSPTIAGSPLPAPVPPSNRDGSFYDFQITNVEDIEVTINNVKVKRKNIIIPDIASIVIDGVHPIENSDKVLIEIYRPAKVVSDESLSYYETGFSFPVVEVNGVKYHATNNINQAINAYGLIDLTGDGDYYYKNRAMVTGDTTATVGDFYVVDKNFSEVWSSAVWSQGRPVVVDNSVRREYYPAMLRFSQSYIYGTNINNTNRFYPLNFEEADASYGDILRLKTRENFIRMFQRHKVGMIPIYRQIIVDNATSSQVALSERLLNKPNYYSGDYGIDKYGSSLISTDYGDYFVDTLNKAIVRVSLDGITNVSDTNNLMTWSNDNIFEDSYGYGCFNYENRNVIMLIGRLTTVNNQIVNQNKIVAYNEPKKKFESFYSYTEAQAMLFINGIIYSFLGTNPVIGINGKEVYKHDNLLRNNFFEAGPVGVPSEIHTVFNGNVQLKKTYTAIEELSTSIWEAVVKTGPLTNQRTTVVLADFFKEYGNPPFRFTLFNRFENKFNATIKRDMNTGGNKYFGDTMKGLYAQVELTNNSADEQRLISVSLKYIDSPLTNR